MRKIINLAAGAAMVFGSFLMLANAASANPVAGGGYSSSYSGESAFTSVAAGQSGQMSAIFFNDGTTAWAPGVVGLLICAPDKVTCNTPSNSTFALNWFSSTVYATVTTTVEPGQNGFFVYSFQVPANTPTNTVTTFYGDVGLIATGQEFRPEGYFQSNTVPQPAFTLSVTPNPASVGVGSTQQFTVSGAPAGVAVTWSVNGGCGAVTTTGLFAATAMNSASQPCTVVASTLGGSGVAAVTVFGPPTSLGCSITPTTIIANGGTTGGVATASIALKDANGNVVANASLPAILINNITPSLATMTPTGSVTPLNGVVSVTIQTTNVAGAIQVSASAPNVIGCNAIITSQGPGAATGTFAQFTVSPIAADGVSTSTLNVDVVDANGTRIVTDSSTQISVSMPNGAGICSLTGVTTGSGGSASGGSGVTIVQNGRAAFSVVSTTTPGTCLFQILTNNTSIAGTTASLTTQIVGAPNRLALISNDGSTGKTVSNTGTCTTTSGTTNTNTSCVTMVVAVQDGNGSVITSDNGTTITPTFDSTSCSGAGGGNPVVAQATTTQAGRATFAFTSTGAYSGCSITFSRSGVSSVNATAVWLPSTASALGCTFTPNPIFHDGSSVSSGIVSVRDRFGNSLGSGSYSVQFALTGGTGATTLISPSPQNTSNGFATFTVQSRLNVIGTDTYTASLSGATGLTPGSCTINVN